MTLFECLAVIGLSGGGDRPLEIIGRSGIIDRKVSRCPLNVSTVYPVIFLISGISELNSLAPTTCSDSSLSLHTLLLSVVREGILQSLPVVGRVTLDIPQSGVNFSICFQTNNIL